MTARRPQLYVVTFDDATGSDIRSRVFQTVRAARNWARFLRSQHYVTAATIWRGQPGGERVEG